MIIAMFDKYIVRRNVHVILQNFEGQLAFQNSLKGFLSNAASTSLGH